MFLRQSGDDEIQSDPVETASDFVLLYNKSDVELYYEAYDQILVDDEGYLNEKENKDPISPSHLYSNLSTGFTSLPLPSQSQIITLPTLTPS